MKSDKVVKIDAKNSIEARKIALEQNPDFRIYTSKAMESRKGKPQFKTWKSTYKVYLLRRIKR